MNDSHLSPFDGIPVLLRQRLEELKPVLSVQGSVVMRRDRGACKPRLRFRGPSVPGFKRHHYTLELGSQDVAESVKALLRSWRQTPRQSCTLLEHRRLACKQLDAIKDHLLVVAGMDLQRRDEAWLKANRPAPYQSPLRGGLI